MHRTLKLFSVAILLTAATIIQVRAQEVQVAFDEDGRLTVIDADLESHLDLFPSYDAFREARLFRVSDGTFILVIQYAEDGATVQDREPLTASDVSALRERITEAMVAANIRPTLDQEGRVSLLWTSAGMSLLAYGPSLVGVLDIENETAVGTIVLLTGAAGFFVPYYITQSIPVSRAAAALNRTGATMGYLHGVALSALVGGSATSSRAVVGTGLVVSLAEAYAGYRFATSTDLSHGSVETMTAGSLFGAGIGFGAGVLVLGEDFEDGDAAIRTLSGLGLAGSLGGTYVGYRLSRSENYSRGDARVLSTVGLLGTQAGAALLEVTDATQARPGAALMIGSTVVGLAGGHLLAHGRDFTSSEGNFMALGSLAGGLVGAAVSNLVGDSPATGAVLSTIGSAAGFSVMYLGYRNAAAQRAGRTVNLSVAPTLDPVTRTLRPGFYLQAGL